MINLAKIAQSIYLYQNQRHTLNVVAKTRSKSSLCPRIMQMKTLQLRRELNRRGKSTLGSLAELATRLVDAITAEGGMVRLHSLDDIDVPKPAATTLGTSEQVDTSTVEIAGTKTSNVRTSETVFGIFWPSSTWPTVVTFEYLTGKGCLHESLLH